MTRQGSPAGAVHAPARAGLEALFAPRSIAVVGASNDPAKWGHILARRALESGVTRPARSRWSTRRGGEVLGRPAYASLVEARAALGEPLELVVVCVPAPALVATVQDAVTAGARAIVAITAGLAELGPEGALLEAEAVAAARAGDALLVGPNCLGVADTGAGLQLGHALLPPGGVTVLSQSGNFVLDLAPLLAERGLGVARFVSVGNQADVTVVELMRSCVEHEATRAVAVYAEDVVDGRGFVEAARTLVGLGKPVVLLSPGRSAAAARSAVSHTGSMTSPAQVVDAACAEAGVRRVDNPTQMADLLEGLLGERRMPGRGAAVLTDGGGHGAMAADTLESVGLELPSLEPATRDRLRMSLWASSTVANPVDLAGAGDRDPMNYARAVEALLAADEVDGVLMTGYFGGYSADVGTLQDAELRAAEAIVAAVGGQGKPLVVHTIFPAGPTATTLRAGGIPVHRDVDRAAEVLAGLVARTVDDGPARSPLPWRQPRSPTRRTTRRRGSSQPPVSPSRSRAPFTSRDELASALAVTGLPVVLKALGSVHKSDGGGVVLGLADGPSIVAAYDDLVARLDPPAVSVEAMADLSAGVELIVGCVRDRTFGPVLMVGLGGIYAEVLADTACALAPVDPDRARDLLLSLRGAALLRGARGRAPVDLDAVADAVSAVSVVAARAPGAERARGEPVARADLRGAGPRRARRPRVALSPRRRAGSAGRTRGPTSPWPGRRRGRRPATGPRPAPARRPRCPGG